MNTKSILIAGVLAVVLVIAGLLATKDGSSEAADVTEDGAFLAGFYDRINDVALLEIATTDATFNVRRDGERWTLDERFGYPVQVDQVRSALIALADMETVEEKTGDPARYADLGVQPVGGDPTADHQSRSVTLMDEAGAELASVIVGKTRSGGRGGTFYVRRPAETASWLVKGKLPALPDSGDAWLDKKILELKRDEVKAARIAHQDGERVTISKEEGETDFSLHEMPSDRELAYASAPGSIAGALQYLNFEDVERAEGFEAPGEALSVSNYWSRDGLKITVELWDKEETPYARFQAAYDPDSSPTLALGPMPSPEEPSEGEEDAEAPATYTPRPADEVRAEAEALNARLEPWIFKLPAYTKTNLTKRVEGMLEPLPEPEETAEEPAGEAPLEPGATIDIDSLGGDFETPAEEPLEDQPMEDEAPIEEEADSPSDG